MKIAKHLAKNIFSDAVEMKANRDGFGAGLKEAGTKNSNVVALAADLTESTRTNEFAEEFPERFIECGIAEQNMASVASGMSAMGKVPFIASYAMFSPGRNWEQIRTTIAYNNSNVKIIGAHAGVSVGPDGATHQAIEDIALMRVVPNMTVIAPADAVEAKKAVLFAAEHKGPVYIRLAREKTPVVTTEESPFEFGKAMLLAEPSDGVAKKACIVVTGTLVHNALLAAKELNDSSIGVSVLHLPTIKPLDTEAILKVATEHEFLITVEEHQRAGGMGSAVTEFLSQEKPTKIIRLGIDDQFGQSGTPEELIRFYKLDVKTIINMIKNEV